MFALPILLIFLRLFDQTVLFLHGFEPERIRHQCLVGRLLLLFDCEKRVLPNFGSDIASGIGILNRNEVLV